MPKPANVGFLIPQFGAMATPETLRHIGTLAEELGFESIWAADHLITPLSVKSPYPYNKSHTYGIQPKTNVLEPFVSLGYLAAATTTVKLGFSVLILPYRHPLETAKLIATLDVLSNGRVMIGAGVGWMEEEFTALGVPFRERGRRADEIIEIWKQAWTQDVVNYEGRHFQIQDVACFPQPVQKPMPHLSIGGHSEAAYRRMFRQGANGFQVVLDTAANSYGARGSLKADLEVLRSLAEEYGRDPDTIEITGVFITSTPETFVAEMETYRKLGMTRFILDFLIGSPTLDGVERDLRTIASDLGA